MNKIFLSLATFSVAFSVQSQTSLRQVDSLTNLLATLDPAAAVSSDKLTYQVLGYYTPGDWGGPRLFTATTTLPATNFAHDIRSSKNSSYYWTSADSAALPQLGPWWGIRGDNLTDNSARVNALLAYTNVIAFPPGAYQTGPMAITAPNGPLKLTALSGAFFTGWTDTNNSSEVRFILNSVTTNAFFTISPSTPASTFYGAVIEGITFDAQGNAPVAFKLKNVTRGEVTRVRPRNALVGAWLEDVTDMTFNNLSISKNEYPFTHSVDTGLILTNDVNGNIFTETVISGTTNKAIVVANRSKVNSFVGGAVESNLGGGIYLSDAANFNSFSGIWFENNTDTNNFVNVAADCFGNNFSELYFENRVGRFYLLGGYNTISGSQFGDLYISTNAGNNTISRTFLSISNTVTGGGEYAQNIQMLVDGSASWKTNTLQGPLYYYGRTLSLGDATPAFPHSRWTYNGIYFGDSLTAPTVGWTRYSSDSLSTSNTVLYIRSGANDGLETAYVAGDTQPRYSLNINGTLGFGPGGTATPDTIWKRNGTSGWLTTNDVLSIAPATNSTIYRGILNGDSSSRLAIQADGEYQIGNGGVSGRDVKFYRPQSNILGVQYGIQLPILSTAPIPPTTGGVFYLPAANQMVMKWSDSSTNRFLFDTAGVITTNLLSSSIYTLLTNFNWATLTNSITASNSITLAYDTANNKLLISAAPSITNVFSTGLTNSGTTVYGNYFPGANMEAVTNGTMVTFNAIVNTNALTNSWQIAIDSTIVLTPNIVDSTEINPSAAGTNLSFALFNNSVTTNKIDSTFYNWVLSQAGGQVRVDGTTVTNIKTSSDITFTTGSSEATPALTTTAVTPGSYSNATITVDSKGRLTAASATPQPQRTELSVDGTYMTSANLADSAMIAVTAAGTNVSMSIPDGVITTNKVDSTFYSSLTPYLGKVRFRANPNALSGNEVTDITAKGCISTVLWSDYASSLGCVYYDEYEIVISPALPSADYFVTIMIGGSIAAQVPYAGVRDNDDGSYPLTTTGFKIWRAPTSPADAGLPCLDDGNWVTVLISNY